MARRTRRPITRDELAASNIRAAIKTLRSTLKELETPDKTYPSKGWVDGVWTDVEATNRSLAKFTLNVIVRQFLYGTTEIGALVNLERAEDNPGELVSPY